VPGGWGVEPELLMDFDQTKDAVDRLEALSALARTARTEPVDQVLDAVATAARDAVGFRSVVVNVYRPAWHDYQAVIVLGSEAIRDRLLGTANTYEQFHEHLLVERCERVPGAFFLPAGEPSWDLMPNTYIPRLPASDDPSAWQAEDGLLVELKGVDGAPLAVVSVDEPASGKRPSDADIRMLVAVCAHAALALETAQARHREEARRRSLSKVVGFAADLAPGASQVDVLDRACATAAPAMGFQSAAALLPEGQSFVVVAQRGRPIADLPSSFSAEEFEQDGCLLLAAGGHSEFNGVGPCAWSDHLLCVAMRRPRGELAGVLAFDDPTDRLLPDEYQRQELRLLADQAVAALDFAGREPS
jgi:hypothetical protein